MDNIGDYIRKHNVKVTAEADVERYEAIKVTLTVAEATGVGYGWDFDTAFRAATASLARNSAKKGLGLG